MVARMLSLYLLSHRQLSPYLALLAMLMLFVAPVISQSLAHRFASAHCTSEVTIAHNTVPNIKHGTHTTTDSACSTLQDIPHHLFPNPGSSPMEDIACGYCQLLIHFPLITNVFVPFIWMLLLVSQATFSPATISPLLPVCYLECQPRAPPRLFPQH